MRIKEILHLLQQEYGGRPKRVALPLPWQRILRRDRSHDATQTKFLDTPYGPIDWQLPQAPISVLVVTVLFPNTSDADSKQAFRSFIDSFSDWEAVAIGSKDMPQF